MTPELCLLEKSCWIFLFLVFNITSRDYQRLHEEDFKANSRYFKTIFVPEPLLIFDSGLRVVEGSDCASAVLQPHLYLCESHTGEFRLSASESSLPCAGSLLILLPLLTTTSLRLNLPTLI